MDENTCMVEVARFFMNFTQRESCGKCVPCREGTKRMLEILERIVEERDEMSDLDDLEELASTLQSMALCGLGKSAPLPVISTLNASATNMRNISGIRNAVQKSVRHCVSSISIRNSVLAAENVRRTVRQGAIVRKDQTSVSY